MTDVTYVTDPRFEGHSRCGFVFLYQNFENLLNKVIV